MVVTQAWDNSPAAKGDRSYLPGRFPGSSGRRLAQGLYASYIAEDPPEPH